MRKFFLNFVLSFLLAAVLSLFLPWWSVMLAALLVGLVVHLRHTAAFISPFLAISLYWLIYAWWLSSANDFVLAQKIAVLLPLEGSASLLILVTGIMGGIAAGISGSLASTARSLFRRRERSFTR